SDCSNTTNHNRRTSCWPGELSRLAMPDWRTNCTIRDMPACGPGIPTRRLKSRKQSPRKSPLKSRRQERRQESDDADNNRFLASRGRKSPDSLKRDKTMQWATWPLQQVEELEHGNGLESTGRRRS